MVTKFEVLPELLRFAVVDVAVKTENWNEIENGKAEVTDQCAEASWV